MSELPTSPLFALVKNSEASGVKFGNSENLREGRPEIPYGAVWCERCNKPCDFEESGMHNLFGKPDASGNHRGYILIRAECHGEEADIVMTFQQARENAGKCIVAFGGLGLEKSTILHLPTSI